jgi:hypothetical protein
MAVLQLLFPAWRSLVLAAGILTATWFYPPYGTPNMEQTAFFFSLLAILACAAAASQAVHNNAAQAALLCFAGVGAVLSFLSKQNAGLLILPVFPLIVFAGYGCDWRRMSTANLWVACGMFVAAAAFALWLCLASDPYCFVQHFFKIPSQEGMSRILDNKLRFAECLVWGPREDLVFKFMASAMVLGGYVAWRLSAVRWWQHAEQRNIAIAAGLCLYLPLFQSAFASVTSNQWQECLPYPGIVIACAAALAIALGSQLRESGMSGAPRWRPGLG